MLNPDAKWNLQTTTIPPPLGWANLSVSVYFSFSVLTSVQFSSQTQRTLPTSLSQPNFACLFIWVQAQRTFPAFLSRSDLGNLCQLREKIKQNIAKVLVWIIFTNSGHLKTLCRNWYQSLLAHGMEPRVAILLLLGLENRTKAVYSPKVYKWGWGGDAEPHEKQQINKTTTEKHNLKMAKLALFQSFSNTNLEASELQTILMGTLRRCRGLSVHRSMLAPQ